MGPGVALALRDASGSGGVVVGGVAGSCDVGWVGGESEVVEDVTDELGIADVREDGAGSSAGTGEDVVEVDALDKRSSAHRRYGLRRGTSATSSTCRRALRSAGF